MMAQTGGRSKRPRSDEERDIHTAKRSKSDGVTKTSSISNSDSRPKIASKAITKSKVGSRKAENTKPTEVSRAVSSRASKNLRHKVKAVTKPSTSKTSSASSAATQVTTVMARKTTKEKSVETGEARAKHSAGAGLDSEEAAKSKSREIATDAELETASKKTRTRAKVVINKAKSDVLDIYVCGGGDNGQLGMGSKLPENIVEADMDANKPTMNSLLSTGTKTGPVDFAVGGMHAAVLTKDNRVLTWGVNDVGALGRSTSGGEKYVTLDEGSGASVEENGANSAVNGHSSDFDDDTVELVDTDLNSREATPFAIEGLSSKYKDEDLIITDVTAGDSCTYLVTDEGLVYGCGQFRNESGPLGFLREGREVQQTVIPIPRLKGIKTVVAGANHVLALSAKGAVYTWGAGARGQLGRRLLARGSREKSGLMPEKCALYTQKVKHIAAGAYHSFAIDDKDDVYAWGQNSSGQCGLPIVETEQGAENIPYPTKVDSLCGRGITNISAGEGHSMAVTKDGDLLVWGRVTEEQGGHDLTYLPKKDKIMLGNKVRALKAPTKMKFFGRRDKAQENEVSVNITSSACGTYYCAALTNEGKLYTWGDNLNKQCGLGKTPDLIKRCIEVDESGGGLHGKRVVMVGCGGSFTVIGTAT